MFNQIELEIISHVRHGRYVYWAAKNYDYKFSEEFIRKFSDQVSWWAICAYQKLSESFIEEFQDEMYWDYIFRFQKLSENFIMKFSNKSSLDYIPFIFISKNHERSWKTFL